MSSLLLPNVELNRTCDNYQKLLTDDRSKTEHLSHGHSGVGCSALFGLVSA
jgi:hypothetical protein